MTWADACADTRSSSPRSFCEPLWLPGWSDRSVWGYDKPTGSYFAQLWPDGDDGDSPAIWVGAVGGVGSLKELAIQVAARTGEGVALVEALARTGGDAGR